MTNYEAADPDSVKKVFAEYFSINKITHEIGLCCNTACRDCMFRGIGCNQRKKEWLDQPAFDPEKDIDWSKVPVDTPVIVKNKRDLYEHRRYFNDIDKAYITFRDGMTSWSAYEEAKKDVYIWEKWDTCRLASPEDIEKYRKKEMGNE